LENPVVFDRQIKAAKTLSSVVAIDPELPKLDVAGSSPVSCFPSIDSLAVAPTHYWVGKRYRKSHPGALEGVPKVGAVTDLCCDAALVNKA
jgi:hypothetical protein